MKFSFSKGVFSNLLIVNTFIIALLFINYFEYFPQGFINTGSVIYAAFAVFGQAALLVFLLLLVCIPLYFLPKKLTNVLVALLFTGFIAGLLVDVMVFEQYRFHINPIIIKLVTSGDIVSFAFADIAKAAAAIIVVFLGQWLLISKIEKLTVLNRHRKNVLWGLFAAFFSANLMNAYAVANSEKSITTMQRYLPLYYPLRANSLLDKLGLVNTKQQDSKIKLTKKAEDINYPIKPLVTENVDTPKDILFLVIDSWRYDTFSPEVTPNLWRWGQQGINYHQHMSTGNSTRTGLFGLFYGMPGTYWHSFLANRRSPVFMDRLQALNYDIGIFASAQLKNPEFNQTIFTNVPNLRLNSKGDSPYKRDLDLVSDWEKWFDNAPKDQSRFSFLFFDAPHGYDFPADFPQNFKPMADSIKYLSLDNETDPLPIMNRYKTSVQFVDTLAKRVYDKLKQSGRLDNTVVVITGDHSQEINDNHQNYWGHNGNFTEAQIKVPFAIIAPDLKPQGFQNYVNAYSSHEDVVPTLLTHYLGVKNPTSDYSTGIDLFAPVKQRDWFIASSYNKLAIIDKHNIFAGSLGGMFDCLDKHNRHVDKDIPTKTLKSALEEMSRFLK
ncbi:sulfatase-like hydrolase/transferase [Parashewanella tropica]|uniref:sulfatase-like hydrolase/transferase n=1 Tax=Parashewanella tropica TaxID=2547970 RepID=UPI00105A5AB7|nr:sulfatase-like hydrolase/transferase [Parashewanella tropica]